MIVGVYRHGSVMVKQKKSHKFLNRWLSSLVDDAQPSSTYPAGVPLPAEVIHPSITACLNGNRSDNSACIAFVSVHSH